VAIVQARISTAEEVLGTTEIEIETEEDTMIETEVAEEDTMIETEVAEEDTMIETEMATAVIEVATEAIEVATAVLHVVMAIPATSTRVEQPPAVTTASTNALAAKGLAADSAEVEVEGEAVEDPVEATETN